MLSEGSEVSGSGGRAGPALVCAGARGAQCGWGMGTPPAILNPPRWREGQCVPGSASQLRFGNGHNPRCEVVPALRVQWAVLMLAAGFNTCKDGMTQGSLKGPRCKSNNVL